MAKIPLETGREQITRQPLAVRQQPGIFSTEVARASQELAKTTAAVARQFEEAQSLAERTSANTKSLRAKGELLLEAQSAKTIDDIAKFRSDYPNRISKIREEATKTITLPQAKNEFGRIFDRDAVSFDFSIRKTLRGNQNSALEIILDEAELENRSRYIAGDYVEQHISKTEQNLLDVDARNRGIITTKQLGERKIKRDKEWELAWVDHIIETDAEDALAELKKGDDGIFSNVDVEDRLTKETKARTKMEKNKKVAEKLTNERHTANEIDLTQKYFTNELFFEDIQGQFVSGDISQKYAVVLNTLITTPKAIDARTDDAEFGKLITSYLSLDESKLDDLRKFRVKVLGLHAAGSLSRDDAQFLINKTVDPFTAQKAEGKGFLSATIETLRSWAEMVATPVSGMLSKFLNRVNEQSPEETIIKASQDIIAEEQRAINPNRARYEIGDIIKLNSGEWKVVGYKDDGDPIIEKQ